MFGTARQLCNLWLRHIFLLFCVTALTLVAVGWKAGYRATLIPQNQRQAFDRSFFIPEAEYPNILPEGFDSFYPGCSDRENLAFLRFYGENFPSYKVYRIGYFWVGTSANIHFMVNPNKEREKIWQKIQKDACQQ